MIKKSGQLLGKIFIPEHFLSWHSFLLISLGLFVLSQLLLAEELINITWIGSQFFLIAGLHWLLLIYSPQLGGASLGSAITGLLVSMILFAPSWTQVPPIAWISWPIISSLMAIVPNFFQGYSVVIPSISQRLKLLLFVLVNILISCWIGFYFLIQSWITSYPLLAKAPDINNSLFVVKSGWIFREIKAPKGEDIIKFFQKEVNKQFNNKPWNEVEQRIEQTNKKAKELENTTSQKTDKKRDDWWQFDYESKEIPNGYNIILRAYWKGFPSLLGVYYLEQSCNVVKKITKADQTPLSEPVSTLQCNPIEIKKAENK